MSANDPKRTFNLTDHREVRCNADPPKGLMRGRDSSVDERSADRRVAQLMFDKN